NGLETEHSSNSFDLNGVTVNLLEAKEGVTVRVEVRHDVDAVVDKIKEFVNMYNELVDELNSALREEVYRDFPPLTDEQRAELSDKEIEMWEEKAKSGLLRSDSIVSGILSEMRLALAAAVQGEEGSISLADIGITTGSWYEYGRLNINESKLRAAVEENPDAVQRLFTSEGEATSGKGIARRLEDVLDKGMARLTQTAGKATDVYDKSFYGERIREYESRLSAMEERLLRYEETQWRKFTAMERVLGQLYAQSDWLTQQLFAMQG
nr:flagellar filament capping protein FliD [Bacillota bacterium]